MAGLQLVLDLNRFLEIMTAFQSLMTYRSALKKFNLTLYTMI